MIRTASVAALAALLSALAPAASAQVVKVTPLGGFDGEFCAQDRALVFEDPNGTRILYDPGRTVVGAGDARLGKIDIVLVTHMHGDHVGNAHTKAVDAGSCASPDMSVSAQPNTSAVNIALAKKAKIVTGSEMPPNRASTESAGLPPPARRPRFAPPGGRRPFAGRAGWRQRRGRTAGRSRVRAWRQRLQAPGSTCAQYEAGTGLAAQPCRA